MNIKNIKGSIILLIVAVLWGSGFISQYIGGRLIGSFTFSAGRAFIGVVFLFLVVIIKNYLKTKKIYFFEKEEDVKYLIKTSLLTGIVLSSAILIQQIGVERTTSAKSGFISSLTIVCVPLILFIFCKKKIKLTTMLFIITSLVGAFLLNYHSDTSITNGDIICFVSTICFSIDIIIISNIVKKLDPIKFSLFRFIVLFLISIICLFVTKEKVSTNNLFYSQLSIVYSGIFVIGLAYTGQIIGEKYCPPVIATLIMSLEGASAAILGYFILGQSLNQIQLIGCLIVIISNIIVQITYYYV